MRAVTGAIHSAAGNKQGVKSAQKFRFHAAKAQEISTSQAAKLFPADPEAGLYTQEQILAEAQKRAVA